MVNTRLQMNSYYSLKKGFINKDTVQVTDFDNKQVYFRYYDEFTTGRNLPIEVFVKCYEYDKTFNLLWGTNEKSK